MHLSQWQPRSMLSAQRSEVAGPTFPVIDVHNHLGRWLSNDDDWLVPDVSELLAVMDASAVDHIVNLDGRWGDELCDNIARYDAAHPARFSTFCHLDWRMLEQDDTATSATEQLLMSLETSSRAGARGVKVWKDLGLTVRDATGALVMPDDARVVAALQAAGELDLPVLIHTADPVAFFEPLDAANERWDELQANPHWWFGDGRHPTFEELMGSLDRLLEACPGTTFIGAHVGCWAENLDAVGDFLSRHRHWHVDLGGRLAEIGRQPRRFAALVEQFPERVLFGTDAFPPTRQDYSRYYRFLQTSDEHFAYSDEQPPPQGRWSIYGCRLPDQLLRAVYRDNAHRLLRLP